MRIKIPLYKYQIRTKENQNNISLDNNQENDKDNKTNLDIDNKDI